MVQELSPEADRRRRVVHEAIEALPISAEVLAKELGVTGATLSRWRSGERKMPEWVVARIADLLRRHEHVIQEVQHKLDDLQT